jgi:hypothetical protein
MSVWLAHARLSNGRETVIMERKFPISATNRPLAGINTTKLDANESIFVHVYWRLLPVTNASILDITPSILVKTRTISTSTLPFVATITENSEITSAMSVTSLQSVGYVSPILRIISTHNNMYLSCFCPKYRLRCCETTH